MKGRILDYSVQSNSGVIDGDDGIRYSFTGAEWRGDGVPSRGLYVDFYPEQTEARAVYIALGSSSVATGEKKKDKVVAGLLAIFLGGLGIHKFYLGFQTPGLIYLLVNTVGFAVTWIMLFIPNIILGIMALIEGIIYLTKTDEEFEETYVVGKKQWF